MPMLLLWWWIDAVVTWIGCLRPAACSLREFSDPAPTQHVTAHTFSPMAKVGICTRIVRPCRLLSLSKKSLELLLP